jgi:hypothetical protein
VKKALPSSAALGGGALNEAIMIGRVLNHLNYQTVNLLTRTRWGLDFPSSSESCLQLNATV